MLPEVARERVDGLAEAQKIREQFEGLRPTV
jgi:hypothetical protein